MTQRTILAADYVLTMKAGNRLPAVDMSEFIADVNDRATHLVARRAAWLAANADGSTRWTAAE